MIRNRLKVNVIIVYLVISFDFNLMFLILCVLVNDDAMLDLIIGVKFVKGFSFDL